MEMLCFFGILMDVVLYCPLVKIVELLDDFHIECFSELKLHLKVHQGLREIIGKLLDIHVEECAIEVGFLLVWA